jgi:twitching motility protein PilT
MDNDIVNLDPNSPPRFEIHSFLAMSVKQGVSDVHLRVNSVPVVRKDGIILKTKYQPLSEQDMDDIVKVLVPQRLYEKVKTATDFDFSMEMQGIARFRVNLLHDLGNPGLVLRVIPVEIPSIEDLYLPPSLKEFTTYNNGLVLITGPTGSGKSTTLATILNYLNQTSQKHVVTLEDPIEFIHNNQKSIFTQRQLEVDTDTFPNGIKYALRQDPDVILIGEMRDMETITSALKAAETGHLVFSTLHTTDAVQTINRIINAFQPYERDAVRMQIASVLRGTVAQKLVKRRDNKGRVPATEVLVVTPAAKDYIERNEIDRVYDLINKGSFNNMMSMNMSLLKLTKAGLISEESALEQSNNPNELQQMLKGMFHGAQSNT